jgi:hypothetical protein
VVCIVRAGVNFFVELAANLGNLDKIHPRAWLRKTTLHLDSMCEVTAVGKPL